MFRVPNGSAWFIHNVCEGERASYEPQSNSNHILSSVRISETATACAVESAEKGDWMVFVKAIRLCILFVLLQGKGRVISWKSLRQSEFRFRSRSGPSRSRAFCAIPETYPPEFWNFASMKLVEKSKRNHSIGHHTISYFLEKLQTIVEWSQNNF